MTEITLGSGSPSASSAAAPERIRSRGLAAAKLIDTRYGIALAVLGVFMAISFATRVGLMIASGVLARDGVLAVVRALAVGEVFDALAFLWLCAPLVVFLSAVPERWVGRRPLRAAAWVVVGASVVTAIFVAVAEILFFNEFNGRFNFVAVDYLIYPTEVSANIRESYPVAWLLTGIAAAAMLVTALIRGVISRSGRRPVRASWRVAAALGYAAAMAGLTASVEPSWAQVSNDRTLNELALNGYYSFWEAYLGQDAPYEGWYVSADARTDFGRLRRLLAEPSADTASMAAGSTLRTIHGSGHAQPLNVVIVLEESLGADFVGTIHPDGLNLTPHFDSLATEGTLLTQAYSTGNRTIRAIEATTSSLPPLPGISIVRRGESVDLFTLPTLLRAHGYSTHFVYGGKKEFDGVWQYLARNGVENVVDERAFPATAFRTAWGVSDEMLFDRALATFDSLHATKKPFYATVLTVSNHRPFTYPAGRIAADPAEKKRENAVRYADYALGRFMRMARTHAFFGNTLFVVLGDHGARVYGAQEIPLPSYHVPILFYGPGIVPAGARVSTLSSSLDVPPTVLAVLGLEYRSKFFGQDALDADSAHGRALMTHNRDLALYREGSIAVLGLRESSTVYRVDSRNDEGRFTKVVKPDSAARELVADAVAYFDGADKIYRGGGYRFDARVPTLSPTAAPRSWLRERASAVHQAGINLADIMKQLITGERPTEF